MIEEIVLFIKNHLGITDFVYNEVEKKISFEDSKHLTATDAYSDCLLVEIWEDKGKLFTYHTDFRLYQTSYEFNDVEEVKELLSLFWSLEITNSKIQLLLTKSAD